MVLDPLLPLGCGELWVGEVVQAEPAAPLCLLGVQQFLGHCQLVGIGPTVNEEVHWCRCIAQGPGRWARDKGGVENLAELVGEGHRPSLETGDRQMDMEKWGEIETEIDREEEMETGRETKKQDMGRRRQRDKERQR